MAGGGRQWRSECIRGEYFGATWFPKYLHCGPSCLFRPKGEAGEELVLGMYWR